VARRILTDPNQFLGEPYFEGTSLPVSVVVQLAEAGLEPDEIVEAYSELTIEDIKTGLDYHARHSGNA
jgi:uncharacterized protein (DUF433 family)